MKVKLKKDVKVSDIPRVSGEHKRLINALSKNKEAELEVMLKGIDALVEESSAKLKKGDK